MDGTGYDDFYVGCEVVSQQYFLAISQIRCGVVSLR